MSIQEALMHPEDIDSAHPLYDLINKPVPRTISDIPWDFAAIPVQRVGGSEIMIRSCLQQLLLQGGPYCMHRNQMVIAIRDAGFTVGGPKTPVLKGLHSHISQLSTRSPIKITSGVYMVIERMKNPKIGTICLKQLLNNSSK